MLDGLLIGKLGGICTLTKCANKEDIYHPHGRYSTNV